jgi:hypothetical protein
MTNLFEPGNAPVTEPESFTVGDFVQWKRTDFVEDYPIASYSAEYVAREHGGGNSEFKVAGTESADYYLFTISSSDSSSITAGKYHWQLEITQTSSGNRIVIDDGDFNIIVDLDSNQADPRIHAEIMIQKIESLLSGKADNDVASYSIAGRSLTKLSFSELTEARDYYRKEVATHENRERIRRGKKGNETIKVRF